MRYPINLLINSILLCMVGTSLSFARDIKTSEHDVAKEKIQKVISHYMTGTFEANGELLKSVFHPSAVMNGFLGDKKLIGKPEVFIKDVTSKPSMKATGAAYKGEVTDIAVSGKIAAVVFEETGFYGEGAFTNYFHLIEKDGDWKIISKTFTTK